MDSVEQPAWSEGNSRLLARQSLIVSHDALVKFGVPRERSRALGHCGPDKKGPLREMNTFFRPCPVEGNRDTVKPKMRTSPTGGAAGNRVVPESAAAG